MFQGARGRFWGPGRAAKRSHAAWLWHHMPAIWQSGYGESGTSSSQAVIRGAAFHHWSRRTSDDISAEPEVLLPFRHHVFISENPPAAKFCVIKKARLICCWCFRNSKCCMYGLLLERLSSYPGSCRVPWHFIWRLVCLSSLTCACQDL